MLQRSLEKFCSTENVGNMFNLEIAALARYVFSHDFSENILYDVLLDVSRWVNHCEALGGSKGGGIIGHSISENFHLVQDRVAWREHTCTSSHSFPSPEALYSGKLLIILLKSLQLISN